MEIRTNEQITAVVYEPPVLVEVGEFSADTLGREVCADEAINYHCG